MKYLRKIREAFYGAHSRFFVVALFVLSLAPLAANAQANSSCVYEVTSLAIVFHLFQCILAAVLVPLLVTVAVVVFIIGILKYIAGADEAAKREEGRKFMIYGIVALFVMVSIWGLVGIIKGTFGLDNSILIPQLMEF